MSKQYLFIPMQPTPNGRLHIGHAGGPYLRADVAARALRRDGSDVLIITGSDAFENWVLIDGLISGRSPKETCAFFHEGIRDDFRILDIEPDIWVNPLSEDHSSAYVNLHDKLLAEIRLADGAKIEEERIPVGLKSGRTIVGTWICGICPSCGAEVGGNTCTQCGDHFQPEDLVNAHARIGDEPIAWSARQNWFLKPRTPALIIEALAATGLREEFLKTVHNYIERRKARIRLSHSGNWGIVSNQAPNGSVLSNTYYAYSLYCGQLYAALRPTDGKNALHRQSNVTVVGFFGTDNSIAGMVAPHAISMETNQYKPFDFTIVNHMAFFEGKKCSTSKNHGIWLHDIHHHTDILSDELRYVLSSIPLDHHVADITVSQLVEGINRLRVWRLTQLHDALTHITGGSKLIEINDELKASLARQSRYLMPESFDLSAALHETDVWLFNHLNRHNTANSKEVIVWLIGVALLGYPFMPQLALNVWQALGQHGFPATTPDTCHRLDCKFHSYRLTINLLKPLTYSQLDYCCRRTR